MFIKYIMLFENKDMLQARIFLEGLHSDETTIAFALEFEKIIIKPNTIPKGIQFEGEIDFDHIPNSLKENQCPISRPRERLITALSFDRIRLGGRGAVLYYEFFHIFLN